ncbi:DUF6624 domain-containing protein [Streptomyces roseoverticillatus]|uniref:DUF6624 domain-containing protein n=1 Tax=Streptomyces roseoverticillatus TaxID=66429 RepID=A0ABV3J540_9ACTN
MTNTVPRDGAAPQRPDLAAELLRRKDLDQHARGVRPDGTRADPDWKAMTAVDADNVAWLKKAVDEVGWPGLTLVGEDACDSAWLFAQHADEHRDFQEQALVLLREAVEAGEAPPWQLAYLTDRCLVGRKEPQLYGTQYRNGAPLPIADAERLDERRASAGMEPHAEYDARMRHL